MSCYKCKGTPAYDVLTTDLEVLRMCNLCYKDYPKDKIKEAYLV